MALDRGGEDVIPCPHRNPDPIVDAWAILDWPIDSVHDELAAHDPVPIPALAGWK
jgi:hypothetical protein